MSETQLAIKSVLSSLGRGSVPMDKSVKAGIAVGFLLRCASSAAYLMLGFYLNRVVSGSEQAIHPNVIAGLTTAFFAVELLMAPVFGGMSDRIGRKPFLLAGPLIGAVAVQIHPLTTLLLVIMIGRILEGLATSATTPGTLGFLSDVTGGDPALRGRVMGLYELGSLVGIVSGLGLGGLMWDLFGPNGLRLLSGLHLMAALLVIVFIKESRPQVQDAEAAPPSATGLAVEAAALPDDQQIKARVGWRERLAEYRGLMGLPRLWNFAPAWIAINGVVGLWFNHSDKLLSRGIRDPQQFLQGGWSGQNVAVAFTVIGLAFMVGIYIWSLFYARLRKTNMMIISIFGAFAVCAVLFAINMQLLGSGLGQVLLMLPLVLSLFVMSGFTPVALAYLADVTEGRVQDRGAVMGLYSVFLAIGQVIGAAIGAPFISAFGFNGMLLATLVLTAVALAAVLRLRHATGD